MNWFIWFLVAVPILCVCIFSLVLLKIRSDYEKERKVRFLGWKKEHSGLAFIIAELIMFAVPVLNIIIMLNMIFGGNIRQMMYKRYDEDGDFEPWK